MNPASSLSAYQDERRRDSANGAPRVPPLAVGLVLSIFVLSAIAPAAPVLPMLSVMLLIAAGVEVALARYAKTVGAARWELSSMFALLWAFAAALSEPHHVLGTFGLAMPQ